MIKPDRTDMGDEIASNHGVWCPHCDKFVPEEDIFDQDNADLVSRITSENVFWDAQQECPHCEKEFTFHVITTRMYLIKKIQTPLDEEETSDEAE